MTTLRVESDHLRGHIAAERLRSSDFPPSRQDFRLSETGFSGVLDSKMRCKTGFLRVTVQRTADAFHLLTMDVPILRRRTSPGATERSGHHDRMKKMPSFHRHCNEKTEAGRDAPSRRHSLPHTKSIHTLQVGSIN